MPVRAAFFIYILFVSLILPHCPAEAGQAGRDAEMRVGIPILLYHRFGPAVADSMTVTTAVFESHLRFLRDNGYTVIPLSRLVAYLLGKEPSPPSRSVVIAADDGHKSVYTDMLPLVRKYRVPVTLFIYPSAISNANYAMTWEQLREIRQTGLFDFQSHTYWHPNFRNEEKRLSHAEYERFVDEQLGRSRKKIERELGVRVEMLAWPFGLWDDRLIRKAKEAGYIAGFTIERRHTNLSDNVMTLPRYIITDNDRGKVFGRLLAAGTLKLKAGY